MKMKLIEYKGEVKSLKEWAYEYNIPYSVFRYRIIKKKYDMEKALTTPVDPEQQKTGKLGAAARLAKKRAAPTRA